jgi:hypothetical protein
MAGYLDNYGAGEERREKTVKMLILGAVVAVILGTVLYFQFRNYREERQVQQFLALLKQKDYKSAYAMFGCTDEQPCPHYAMNKFMEDWGPASPHNNAEAARVKQTKSCRSGIIQFVEFPNNEEVQLWVDRKTLAVGFAPFPVCDPRMKVP